MIVMYILMRVDLLSMNPGKAVAQGAHAANQCIFEIDMDSGMARTDMLQEWRSETGAGFGTTITLGVNARQLAETIDMAKELGFHAGVVHDPSYPLRDGEVTHLIPLDTCGFVFGRKAQLAQILDDLRLMA